MKQKEKILIVDDEKVIRESLCYWFENEGFLVDTAENFDAGLEKHQKNKFDLVLVDLKLPGKSGLELLKEIKEIDKDTIVIMITAFASVSTAIAALKEGAYDYVTKPVDPDELTHLIENAIAQHKLQIENRHLKENIAKITNIDLPVGENSQMKNIFELIPSISNSEASALIIGERGTGKELLAKVIHSRSYRKYFPFVSVKCSALTESMFEQELFGEEPNALRGIQLRRKGKLELAEGGTLYLDEVNSISPKMQVEILKALETNQFVRIGGTEPVNTNFRLIAAANSNLENEISEGKFREDLYYKLNIFTILIPPLRDRREDILLIAKAAIKKYSHQLNKPVKEISAETAEILVNYEWPGNVRELENAIERAIVIGKSNEIIPDDLPIYISSIHFDIDDSKKSLSAIEKKHIYKILNENKWNISKSAQVLEIDRVTLYNKINKYNLRIK